ncbi:MAG: phosphoglycerate kinase [Nitrospirae bacterium]|nr:phosphoglycerate kinase [Nitrospirota bacterium]
MESTLGYLKASDYLRELEGKIALVKSDFNVPLISDGGGNQRVADAFRILQAAPFIKELINAGVIPLLVTHLGRPKGYDPAITLDPISPALADALQRDVEIIRFAPDKGTFSPEQFNPDYLKGLFKSGIIPLLDNIRFHTDETKNRESLAKALTLVADVSIQNSFGTAHRKEATSNRIHEFIPGFAGSLLVDEIEAHVKIKKPGSPYIVIVGGDKVEDSLQLMRAIFRAEKTTHWSNMFNPELNLHIGERLVDYVLVGGHLMYAFVYAQLTMLKEEDLRGLPGEVKKDLRGLREVRLKGFESEKEGGYEYNAEEINLAQGLLRLYNQFQFKDPNPLQGRRLILPVDYAIKREGTILKSVLLHELNDDDEIVDIGDKTKELYTGIVDKAGTIVWNGPLGVDDEKYVDGTRRVIDAIDKNKDAVKEIGGGSTNFMTSSYEEGSGRKLNMGFRSTGGGSTLLETAYDSPVTISLIMSSRKLLEGGYGLKYEDLRKSVIKKQWGRREYP